MRHLVSTRPAILAALAVLVLGLPATARAQSYKPEFKVSLVVNDQTSWGQSAILSLIDNMGFLYQTESCSTAHLAAERLTSRDSLPRSWGTTSWRSSHRRSLAFTSMKA